MAAVSPAGDEVPLGGIAGILSPSGSGTFRFVTGSGPTLEPVDTDSDGRLELPFVDPGLGLAIEEFVVDGPAGLAETFQRLPLTDSVGTPVVGTPNVYTSSPGLALYDEEAVNLFGAPIGPTILGGRFEGATETPNGDIWLADARRCSLWQFNSFGTLVARYTPVGTPGILGGPRAPRGVRPAAREPGLPAPPPVRGLRCHRLRPPACLDPRDPAPAPGQPGHPGRPGLGGLAHPAHP